MKPLMPKRIDYHQIVEYIFDNKYIMQIQPAGIRALIYCNKSGYTIKTSSGIDITKALPTISTCSIKQLKDTVLEVQLSKPPFTNYSLFMELLNRHHENDPLNDIDIHIQDVCLAVPFSDRINFLRKNRIEFSIFKTPPLKANAVIKCLCDKNIESFSFKHCDLVYVSNSYSHLYVEYVKENNYD